MKKKDTEFLTEEETEAILRIPDRRTLQGKRDYAILFTLLKSELYIGPQGLLTFIWAITFTPNRSICASLQILLDFYGQLDRLPSQP